MQFVSKNLHLKYLPAIFSIILLLSLGILAANSDKSLRAKTIANIAKDDTSGEDLKIRRVAINALGNRAGTVVVMSPRTGRIYSIVNQDWAVRKGFKPCSTIKLVTSVAGYNEKLIRPNGNLANGKFRLGLDDSLSYSNNTYFQRVGKGLGSDKLIKYARQLGLGERTGINIPGEFVGKLPYGNENLRIYSHADDFEVTPLQLAVLVSAITNGGDLVIPQVTRTKYQKANFKGFYRRELELSANVFERTIPGMVGAVKYGTAKRIAPAQLKIAGKTGSCIANDTWVGLFASVAPILNPRFSVVVITEGKYARGKYSAAIAGKIYRALSPRFSDRLEGTVARKTITVRSANSKTLAKKSPNKRKADDASFSSNGKKTIGNSTVSGTKRETDKRTNKISNRVVKYSAKKSANKTKELFPTVVIKGKREITRPRIVKNR